MRELRPRADPNVIRAGERPSWELSGPCHFSHTEFLPGRTFERTIDMGSNTVTDTCSRITAADRAKALHLFRARDSGTNTAYDDGDLACLMSAVFGLWRDGESSDSTELPHPTGEGPWRLYPADCDAPAFADPLVEDDDLNSHQITELYVLVIEHKHGSNVTVHFDEQSAKAAAAEFAACWWGERDGPIPADIDEGLSRYFDNGGQEFYTIVAASIEF